MSRRAGGQGGVSRAAAGAGAVGRRWGRVGRRARMRSRGPGVSVGSVAPRSCRDGAVFRTCVRRRCRARPGARVGRRVAGSMAPDDRRRQRSRGTPGHQAATAARGGQRRAPADRAGRLQARTPHVPRRPARRHERDRGRARRQSRDALPLGRLARATARRGHLVDRPPDPRHDRRAGTRSGFGADRSGRHALPGGGDRQRRDAPLAEGRGRIRDAPADPPRHRLPAAAHRGDAPPAVRGGTRPGGWISRWTCTRWPTCS